LKGIGVRNNVTQSRPACQAAFAAAPQFRNVNGINTVIADGDREELLRYSRLGRRLADSKP
jgi:hypothetical protein